MIRIGVFTGSGRDPTSEPVIIKTTEQPQRDTVHNNVAKDEPSSENDRLKENQS